MKNHKRLWALVLALCMTWSVMPVGALATETGEEPSISLGEAIAAPVEEVAEEAVTASGENVTANAAPTKPADGTTTGEPFPENTGGSYSFRIPALVTLSDGTLVAAADARWNTTYDGGGLDTIVSRSGDNGANWSYTFANYLGDNDNVYNGSSTCFIDPSLAVKKVDDTETIYMLVDLYPYGVALNGESGKFTPPVEAVGFNDDDYLKLSTDGTNYTYYLKDGKIYDSNGNAEDGYTVDEYFNITTTATGDVSNLFFSDSPYKVVRTGYLYLTTSTNKGATWSAPTLLNLKTSSEQVCLVGPGRGLVTSDGIIVFPVYSYKLVNNTEYKYTSLIYSNDNGTSWNRTGNIGDFISSEATMVELDNGELRVFVRNELSQLVYADFNLDSGTWGSYVQTGVAVNSDTELSAITYSKTIGGKQVILVSCPTGPNAAGSDNNNGAYRSSGKIFAGIIEDGYTMTWKDGSVPVTNVATGAFSGSTYTAEQGFFAYSCLTELNNNSVAILYEDSQQGWGAGTGYGYTMDYKTYTESDLEKAFGVTFDDDSGSTDDEDTDSDVVNVVLKVGDTKSFTDTTGNYEDTATIKDDTIAIMNVKGTTTAGGSTTNLVEATPETTEGWSGTYYISDGNGNFLTLNGSSLTNTTDRNAATEWTVKYHDTPYYGNGASRYRIHSNGTYIKMENSQLGVVYSSEYNYNNHYFKPGVGLYGSSNGSNAWIYDNGWTVGTAGANSAKLYTLETVTTDEENKTEVTFTGESVGTTTAKVGNTTYYITVVPAGIENVVNVELEVGETLRYTDDTGNYVDVETNEEPDDTIAGMTLAPGKVLQEVTDIESGKQYLIVNANTGAVLTDTETKVSGGWGDKEGLVTTGTASTASMELWTITATGTDYYIMQNGQYLTTAGSYAKMSETAVPLTLNYNNGWTIYDYTTGPALSHEAAGYYLSSQVAEDYAGTAMGTADPTNAYRYWTIYEIVEANTEIAFTGNAIGETYAIVGNTYYNITVEEYILDDEIHDGFTIVPELQQSRYDELTDGVDRDSLTEESWAAYEAARKVAKAMLNDDTTYDTEAEAQEALAKLVAAVDALEAAKKALAAAKTITVNYQLDGIIVLTEEYKIAADATTVNLPDQIEAEGVSYSISANQAAEVEIADGVLTLPADASSIDIALEKIGTLGSGFVSGETISLDNPNTNGVNAIKEGNPVKALTVTTDITFDLNLAATPEDGQKVEWSTGDDKVATVDQDGKVTSTGVGTTTITATVLDAEGNVVAINTIPITVLKNNYEDDDPDPRKVALYIEEVANTTVWCVINGDLDNYAFEVVEGELIYGNFKQSNSSSDSDPTTTTAVTFFGAPDENHALVSMGATSSDDQYYPIHDALGQRGEGTGYFINSGIKDAGYWQAVGLGTNDESKPNWDIIRKMVDWAIAKGSDGAQGFTRRQDASDLSSRLTFISDPMPTVEKSVNGLLPNTRLFADWELYEAGMYAEVGDIIFFTIKVTLQAPEGWAVDENGTDIYDDSGRVAALKYSDAELKEKLDGCYFYTKAWDYVGDVLDGEIPDALKTQTWDITNDLNRGWSEEEIKAGYREHEYYVVYEIPSGAINTDETAEAITNRIDFDFNFASTYSKSSLEADCPAEVEIYVLGKSLGDIVVDFGKSVTLTGLTDDEGAGSFDEENTNNAIGGALYGEVTISKDQTTITYTPDAIMKGYDVVYLMDDANNLVNYFRVYPATTVYYEENFVDWGTDDKWKITGTAKDNAQACIKLGESANDPYGYDVSYANDGVGASNGTQATTATIGAQGTFTFTGTGFDIYANCTTGSGYVAIQLQQVNADGTLTHKMLYMVDTRAKSGTSDATTGQDKDLYSLPIVSQQGLDYGTYQVTITKIVDAESVNIDGIRIYGTMKDSSIFKDDMEDDPEFYELRDYVLKALNIGDTTSKTYGSLAEMAEQVYNEAAPDSAVIVSGYPSTEGITNGNAQDLLDNGPKNEIFLHQGEALVFKVTTDRVMQIGLKAPVDETKYTISYVEGGGDPVTGSETTINTSTDMFYKVLEPTAKGLTYVVTVKNDGDNILSVTDLKICDDPSFRFETLEPDDIEAALGGLGYGENDTEQDSGVTIGYAMQAFLTLEREVYLNVCFKLEGLEAGVKESSLNDRIGLLVWDADELPEQATVENCDQVYAAEWDETNGRFAARTAGIPAAQLGDSLAFRAYYVDDAGNYVYGRIVSGYSPKTYCYNQLKGANTRDDALMVALLNYGAAAQKYFGYNTENLMNSDLTDEQKKINWDGSLVRTDWTVPEAKVGKLVRDESVVTARGAYLSLLGAIDYNYYVGVSGIEVKSVEMLYWTETEYAKLDVLTADNAEGTMKNYTWNSEKSRYEFTFEGLAAKDMFKSVYTCAVITDAKGNVYYSGVTSFCPERYVAQTADSSNAAEAELARAMAIYGDAARTYFG